MTAPRASRLTDLRRDLDRLATEAEHLAESFETETRLAREEAVGAEILVTRDVVAHLGILWDTAEQLATLAESQARHLTRDYLDTLSKLLDGSAALRPAEVFGGHVERRVTHLSEGVERGIEVASRQSRRACESLMKLWSPFLSVVRQDWTGPNGRANA